MKKTLLLTFSLFVVVLTIGLTLNADESGTMLGPGPGGEIGTEEVVSISLENPFGTPSPGIPRDDSYYIWAMWSTGISNPKVTYIVAGVDQDTTRKFTHLIIKENTMSGIVGEACCTAIAQWANVGQSVPIIVKVDGIGTGFKMFTVQ